MQISYIFSQMIIELKLFIIIKWKKQTLLQTTFHEFQ